MTGTIQIASLGIPDTLFIMVLALIVFGPRRLPEIGRQIGKLMYEFRKASNDFKFQMEEEMRTSEEADRRKKIEEGNRQLTPALGAPLQVSEPVSESSTPDVLPAEANMTSAEGIDIVATTVEQPSALQIHPPSTGEPISADKPTLPATTAKQEHVEAPVESSSVQHG